MTAVLKLRLKQQLCRCSGIWMKVMAEYPEIANTSLKTLLSFPTFYLCEAGFSAVKATKTKQRSKLDISNTLRVLLSPMTPRWNRLVAEKQAQVFYCILVS